MVSDLLQGFIPGAWVDELDLATLEKCNGSYISDDLRDRTDDLIWRVRWSHDWFYVYLLLEFQSKIDCWMAVWSRLVSHSSLHSYRPQHVVQSRRKLDRAMETGGFGAGPPRDAPPTHPLGSPPIRSRNRGTDRAAPDSDC